MSDTQYKTPLNVTPLAYTFDTAAMAIGLSRRKIEDLVASGKIKAKRVGTRRIIAASVLLAFVDDESDVEGADGKPDEK